MNDKTRAGFGLALKFPVVLAMAIMGGALTGCDGTRGSGTAGSDTRTVTGFDTIEAHGALEVEVMVGKGPSLTLTGDDNLLPKIESKVVGDRLVIRPQGSMSRTMAMKATVEVPSLEELELHGASEGKVTGLAGSSFTLDAHGASEAELEGKVDELETDLHGASSLDARKLTVKKVEVEGHGASSAELGAPAEIIARLSGASSVAYDGSPSITKDLSGASSINKR